MISGKTKIYGIFGYPVEHTFSPGMHNAAFRHLKMDACYVPFAVHPDHLARGGEGAGAARDSGPEHHGSAQGEHHSAILTNCPKRRGLIGAVNTLEFKKGRLIGHNTDGRGFLRSLREEARFDPRGKMFLCIGSGGAARAVCFSLALAGASTDPVLESRCHERRTACAGYPEQDREPMRGRVHGSIAGSRLQHLLDCLINATPLGLKQGRSSAAARRH